MAKPEKPIINKVGINTQVMEMKKNKAKKLFLSAITETRPGYLEGGFETILTSHLLIAFGGGGETNNCNGGNCAAGCDGGVVNGSGCPSLNFVPGCGTKI